MRKQSSKNTSAVVFKVIADKKNPYFNSNTEYTDRVKQYLTDSYGECERLVNDHMTHSDDDHNAVIMIFKFKMANIANHVKQCFNDRNLFGFRVFTNFIDLDHYKQNGLQGTSFVADTLRSRTKCKQNSVEMKQIDWMMLNNLLKHDTYCQTYYVHDSASQSSTPSYAPDPYPSRPSSTESHHSKTYHKTKKDGRHSSQSTYQSSSNRKSRSRSPRARDKKYHYSSSSMSSVDRSKSREHEGTCSSPGSIFSPPRCSFDKSKDRWLLFSTEKGDWVSSDPPCTERTSSNDTRTMFEVSMKDVVNIGNEEEKKDPFSIGVTLSKIREETTANITPNTEKGKSREREGSTSSRYRTSDRRQEKGSRREEKRSSDERHSYKSSDRKRSRERRSYREDRKGSSHRNSRESSYDDTRHKRNIRKSKENKKDDKRDIMRKSTDKSQNNMKRVSELPTDLPSKIPPPANPTTQTTNFQPDTPNIEHEGILDVSNFSSTATSPYVNLSSTMPQTCPVNVTTPVSTPMAYLPQQYPTEIQQYLYNQTTATTTGDYPMIPLDSAHWSLQDDRSRSGTPVMDESPPNIVLPQVKQIQTHGPSLSCSSINDNILATITSTCTSSVPPAILPSGIPSTAVQAMCISPPSLTTPPLTITHIPPSLHPSMSFSFSPVTLVSHVPSSTFTTPPSPIPLSPIPPLSMPPSMDILPTKNSTSAASPTVIPCSITSCTAIASSSITPSTGIATNAIIPSSHLPLMSISTSVTPRLPTAIPSSTIQLPLGTPPLAISPTTVPPLAISPTAVPPLAISPTAVPLLALSPMTPMTRPPLAISPTTIPHLAISPTAVPPLAISPMTIPPLADDQLLSSNPFSYNDIEDPPPSPLSDKKVPEGVDFHFHKENILTEYNIAADVLIASCETLARYNPQQAASLRQSLNLSLRGLARNLLSKFRVETGIIPPQ